MGSNSSFRMLGSSSSLARSTFVRPTNPLTTNVSTTLVPYPSQSQSPRKRTHKQGSRLVQERGRETAGVRLTKQTMGAETEAATKNKKRGPKASTPKQQKHQPQTRRKKTSGAYIDIIFPSSFPVSYLPCLLGIVTYKTEAPIPREDKSCRYHTFVPQAGSFQCSRVDCPPFPPQSGRRREHKAGPTPAAGRHP